MSGVTVGTLDLRLAAPVALQPRAASLLRVAEEGMIPAVLRAMERRLVQTYGARAVIRISSLDLRLSATPADLASADCAAAVGEDVADQILAMAVIETASAHSPHADAPVRIWRDARHLTAARLSSAAQRQPGPDGAKAAFGTIWHALSKQAPDEIASVLEELAQVQELSHVLTRLSLDALADLSNRLGRKVSQSVAQELGTAIARTRAQQARPDRPAPGAPGMPEESQETSPNSVFPREAGNPPPTNGPVRSAAATRSAARAGQSRHRPIVTARQTGETQLPSPPSAPPHSHLPDRPAPAPSQQGISPQHDPKPAAEGTVPREAAADVDAPEAGQPVRFATDWCGLAYLLPIALRMELPETLWQAGLDEGAVFCRIMEHLAGDHRDPMTRLLSRRFPARAPPVGKVPGWASEEITAAALAHAVRRGHALAGLESRIEALQARLAGEGECDLTTWLAAYLLAIFEMRTGHALAPGRLDLAFLRQGRIELEDELIRIVQPLSAIDIVIRRAGLDADPGWLAWCERRLVFAFEGDEEVA